MAALAEFTAGDRHRERMARRSRESSASVADIGSLPEVLDPERREACARDLELFLTTYFPNSTGISPFSNDHKRVIARIQTCILDGGRFCNAVYRGFAKTTIATNAAIWAVMYGHRRYPCVFSANEPQAQDLISSIKTELSENDLLYEDFPEACHAVRALEGKPQRCASQTYQGELTHIVWRADRVAMPYIGGSLASGAIIASRGVTGSGTRGLVHKQPDGTNQRPDFVIIDDPQTDESAGTLLQVSKRLGIIKRSILKLAGHNRPMACVVNGTVIGHDDVIEQLLDPNRNPAWQGERIKMVRQWSGAHETHWLGRYAELRNGFDRDDPADRVRAQKAATEYYVEHRETMDAGCLVSWEHCYGDGEVSAIQHAYNMLIDDGPDVFSTECQNEPPKDAADESRLSAKEIAKRINGFERYRFPSECEHLTAFIDVQGSLLYYVACAWQTDFTGYVVDYGSWPDQGKKYFRLIEAQRTFDVVFPGEKQESQWYEALKSLMGELSARDWRREDGARLSLGKVLIDANYGLSTKTVKRFCHVSQWKDILVPSHGRGITAANLPMAEWPARVGERKGFNWLLKSDTEQRGVRHVIYDTNYWKSFAHARLKMYAPASGSLSIFGSDPRAHEMLADQLAAEYPVRTTGRGRTVDQWQVIPSEPDNHFLDGLVGCCVGASMLGAMLAEHGVTKTANSAKVRKSLAQMAGRK